ncbi:cyclase [Marmoricola endophyticus]|uniref:Cyclase n=1 Tax=Marmoricola endophyticus TaxID=2040280 RepID=A0A917BA29_9ACTN|nr:SRPBCC family protein [Marmoricola endophyticus]GGF31563.1 cyclase [Marmoricola endophyticus]
MADQTSSSIVVEASPTEVMDVIADFEAYPEWAGMSAVTVLEKDGPRADKVAFELDAGPIKDAYTLVYDWHDDTSVSWTLVEGKLITALDGEYVLSARGGATEVTYRLAVDISIPMIGMLKRRAEKVIIDTALKGLKKRVESR